RGDATEGEEAGGATQGGWTVRRTQDMGDGLGGRLDEGHLKPGAGCQPSLVHGLAEPEVALQGAVRGGQPATYHGDAAMAEVDQSPHDLVHGGVAGYRYTGVGGMAVIDQHVGHGFRTQKSDRPG